MNFFLATDIDNHDARLSPEESFHCIQVLRMKQGEEIYFVDGSGGFFKGIIAEPDPQKCLISIVEKKSEYGKRNYHLHIAIAPTKNITRFEWFLEKATEIGVDEITPLICQHSERREVKPERLNKVIVSAMKQSLKAYLPKLNPSTDFAKLISTSSEIQKFICQTEVGKDSLLNDRCEKGKSILILVGPEGDFSEKEIEMPKKANFIPVSLGESRLRIETAGIVACSIVSLLNQ